MKYASGKGAPHDTSSMRGNRGFTLMELLVVVFIIGLLALVVLALFGEARERGRNSGRIKTIEEYTKALELVRTEDGAYPATTGSGNGWYCLGDYSDNVCWDGGTSEDTGAGGVNDDLDRYIQNPAGTMVWASGVGYEGYRYLSPAGGGSGYAIGYFLEGNDRICFGSQPAVNIGEATYCLYQHQ